VYWLDLVLLILMLAAAWIGYRQGFLRQLVHLLAWIVALIVAAKAYPTAAVYLADSLEWLRLGAVHATPLGQLILNVVAFFLLFFGIRLLIRLAGSWLGIVHTIPVLSTVNRWLGLGLSLLKTALVLFLLFSILSLFPAAQTALADSWVIPRLLQWSPQWLEHLL